MLLIAAVNGEESLRGMWLWGRGAWDEIAEPLDLWGTAGPPAYGTVWGLLSEIDADELGRALYGEEIVNEARGCSIDGKVLCGSKRGVTAGLEVVTAAGHSCRAVLGQQSVTGGDQVAATVALLQGMDISGKMVSMDAGLLNRVTAKTVEEKGGPTSAP
jgi:hypothetical protein